MWKAERAVSPDDGAVTYVLVDEGTYQLQPEVRAFALYLRGLGRSPETMRAYVPRIGVFLNWCVAQGVDFRRVTLLDLTRFGRALEARMVPGGGRRITGKTVNAGLTAVLEFLRFCVAHGIVEHDVVEHLTRRRHLRYPPTGMNVGERGQYLNVVSPLVKAPEYELAPATLGPNDSAAVADKTRTERDRFLIALLSETGARIGEALGLRREDLHLLPDSSWLGCSVAGAHVHVIPRRNNVNGARAKSGRPRTIPVGPQVVITYRDYQVERDFIAPDDNCDYAFINLCGSAAGIPMSYSNAYQILKRAARRAGVENVHPHRFRHTAATAWIRAGVAPDVVQSLLGHASSTSTAVYLHATDGDLRRAVDSVSGLGRVVAT